MIYSKFIKLLKANYIFKKPYKKKILIFDRECIKNEIAIKLFKKNEYEILDIRYENINLYVLFYVLLNHGFKNIKFNYFKLFLEIVSPKIVYTGIDNQLDFFKLKGIYSKATYISDQFGISKNAYAAYKLQLKKDFYWKCKQYLSKNDKKLSADVIFTFGTNEIKNMSRYIDGKYYPLGSTKNNAHVLKKKTSKNKDITFICSGVYAATVEDEKKVFRNLIKFGKKNKIKINFLSKWDKKKERFFRENYSTGKWTYLPRKNQRSSYQYINNSQMIVFTHSTMGFEAFSKGIKVLAIYSHFPEKSTSFNYKRRGEFWTNAMSYPDFEKLIKKVRKYADSKWANIVKKYSSEIMFYDQENKRKIKIINKYKK
jgi:surface carbohydrate biosynthesis protein